jgi:hypothetical protein
VIKRLSLGEQEWILIQIDDEEDEEVADFAWVLTSQLSPSQLEYLYSSTPF